MIDTVRIAPEQLLVNGKPVKATPMPPPLILPVRLVWTRAGLSYSGRRCGWYPAKPRRRTG